MVDAMSIWAFFIIMAVPLSDNSIEHRKPIRKPIIETSDSDAWFEDNIIYVEMKKGAVIDLEAAEMHIEKWQHFINTHAEIKNFALIVNMKGIKSVSREARIYYSKRNDPRSKAVALIIDSQISRIIANFIISFTPPERPLHLFNSREDAFLWIKKFI